MNFIEVIGIDVSKSTIDACIHVPGLSQQFKNTAKGLGEFLNWSKKHVEDFNDVLFVFEHTGMYSHLLTTFLEEQKCHYFTAPALDVKRSMGIVRGKDDKVDAKRIALYGYRLKDEIEPTKGRSEHIVKL